MNKTPNEVFREYLKARIEGRKMTLGELIERYPEHEKYLRRKFAALDMISPPDEGIRKDQDLLAGSIIGDFKIIREISHGGMGVVYLAEQLSLARKVALKILRPSIFTDQKQIERFRQEGKAIAKLQHNGIVPVHLIGEHEGLFYIAMQYIEGLPLSKLIHYAKEHGLKSLDSDQVRDLIAAELPKEERSSAVAPAGSDWIEMACNIMISVCEAVEYAHGQGIFHRDIKPSNIILTKDGVPVLLDFGLSKDLTSTDLTPTGEFLGTPAYCAPEQLFSEHPVHDARIDVYSLGMTLYELLTFNLPYEGGSVGDLISAIKVKNPISPVKFNNTISSDLDTVIMKAIRKKPSKRYQNVAELEKDIKRSIRIPARKAKPLSFVYKSSQYLKRFRKQIVITIIPILLISSLVGLIYHLSPHRKIVRDFSKLFIDMKALELRLNNLSDTLPVHNSNIIYIPGYGVIFYYRFDDNCSGECAVNYVPFQSIVIGMSFFSASESLNSLPNDENITVYVEHDKFVDTSTISRRDNVFNKKLFDKHKKPSGLRDSMKITYDKDKYNLYTYLEQMVLGFTTQNNFGENLRSIINLPISTFKKLGGNVISIYIPEKVLSFIVNVPLQSGNPALNNFFSGVIMKDLNDMALEEEPRNNIPLNVVINTSGGQLSNLTWKDNLNILRSRWPTDTKSFCDFLREDYMVLYTNGVAYECSDADLKKYRNDN